MDIKSSDVVALAQSPVALALIVAVVILVGLIPIKDSTTAIVTELHDVNSNIEELTDQVGRHERLLADLSAKVDNLSKERK
jgi:cell division protein FtsL